MSPSATQLADPKCFQQLTEGDVEDYRRPELCRLNPPRSLDPACETRRQNWIEWRAAPYPAARHAEYLFRPDLDSGEHPRILISAAMTPPDTIEDYVARYRTKRRLTITGRRAENNGYTARAIDPADEAEGIWHIIHSSTERQGRDIAPAFGDRPKDFDFPNYRASPDPNYQCICMGVFSADGQLAAYLLGLRVGEHVQYDEIMGHHSHVKYDVMYFLHFNFLRQCLSHSPVPRCLNYGPWYSGADPYVATSGLNFWKRRVGFQPVYLIAEPH